MWNIRIKKHEIILYIILALSVLDIIPISFGNSLRYKLMLCLGLVLYLYCATVAFRRSTPVIIKVAYVVCVINAFSILSSADNIYNYIYMLMEAVLWMLVMIAVYGLVAKCSKPQEMGSNIYYCIGIIFLICGLLCFRPSLMSSYREWVSMLYKLYYPLCLLPLVLITKKRFYLFNGYVKYSKVFVILIVGVLILLSSKRGGFIALVCGIAIYYSIIISITPQRSKRLTYIRNVTMIFALALIVLIVLEQSGEFEIFNRLSSIGWNAEGTSGRTEIWKELLSVYDNGTIIQKLFGFGHNATYNYTTISVAGHNDYINNLFNYGLISVSLQIFIILGLIFRCFRMVKMKNTMAPAFGCSLAIFFVLSMVSICISTSEISLYLGYIWGLVLGNSNKEQEQLTGQKNILLV